ncbi:unnamed protein product [Linum trigynum]|uniref:Uncharacterized protein n=1 Tax=Linum trigynum TaxID=586398 RepID=A0AAV2DBV2_9ROSI
MADGYSLTEGGKRHFKVGGESWGSPTLFQGLPYDEDIIVVEAQVSTFSSVPPKSTKQTGRDSSSKKRKQPEGRNPPPLALVSPNVARTTTMTGSLVPLSSLQLTTRNLIAQLSPLMCSGSKLTTPAGACLPQQDRRKLVTFFEMTVEAILKANAFDAVEKIVRKMADYQLMPTDHPHPLKNMLSRLAEFKEAIPASLTMIESCSAIETSRARNVKDLERRLAQKQKELSVLESEVSRLGVEEAKLEAQIRALVAFKEKMAGARAARESELEKINGEATREVEELKRQMHECNQAGEGKMVAKEKLAQFNASWKLFRDYLGF